jgi:hypothetical protein
MKTRGLKCGINSNQSGLNKVFRLRKVIICRIIILIGTQEQTEYNQQM